jgi:hypothetical protein
VMGDFTRLYDVVVTYAQDAEALLFRRLLPRSCGHRHFLGVKLPQRFAVRYFGKRRGRP